MSAFSNRKQGRIRSSRNGIISGSDPAFRATNKDILLWINRTLNTSFSSLTDASNGAAHCQLCHMLHPSAFGADWKKVNWTAKNDYELVNNFSILNRAFNKANIEQNVPVEALAKGKKVENLKFWQWMIISSAYRSNFTSGWSLFISNSYKIQLISLLYQDLFLEVNHDLN